MAAAALPEGAGKRATRCKSVQKKPCMGTRQTPSLISKYVPKEKHPSNKNHLEHKSPWGNDSGMKGCRRPTVYRCYGEMNCDGEGVNRKKGTGGAVPDQISGPLAGPWGKGKNETRV